MDEKKSKRSVHLIIGVAIATLGIVAFEIFKIISTLA